MLSAIDQDSMSVLKDNRSISVNIGGSTIVLVGIDSGQPSVVNWLILKQEMLSGSPMTKLVVRRQKFLSLSLLEQLGGIDIYLIGKFELGVSLALFVPS